ncbi:MAG: hypothetical protein CMJ64_05040 [Planctomycetaceae bacterium]|nr:hypothetical protein [Planctomycetaceae bacterium]
MTSIVYQQQLRHLIRAMSMPNREASAGQSLASGSTPARVKMFVDGNLEKRREKLETQLLFVADAFEGFDRFTVDFIRAEPLATFGSAVSDGEAMLRWLPTATDLSPIQRDYITCQRARHTIEEIARENRIAYVRFQELSSIVDQFLPQLGNDDRLRILLNPTRTWSRFETSELLDGKVPPPSNVLFFATRGDVATAALELEGQALLNELVDYQPCTLAEWASVSTGADRDELLAFCRDLAEMGLVAIG